MKKPTPIIYHNTKKNRRKAGTDKYPVSLRVGDKILALSVDMSKAEFKKMSSNKPGDFLATKIELQELQAKAARIIKQMEVYSYERFKLQFKDGGSNRYDLLNHFRERIAELDRMGKYETRDKYKTTLWNWEQFLGKRTKLMVGDLTPGLLGDYREWFASRDRSPSTSSLNLRNTRAIWNRAEKELPKLASINPFKSGGFKVHSAKARPDVQTLEEVQMVMNYDQRTGTSYELAKDLWIFLFLCGGINIGDALRMKRTELQNQLVRIRRKKTANKSSEYIEFYWHPKALQIAEKWGTGQELIFPDIERIKDPEEIYQTIKNRTSFYNRKLRVVCMELGLKMKLTTNTARHSFASILIEEGLTPEDIGAAMGHSDAKTTKNYIKSLSNSRQRRVLDVTEKLIPSPKKEGHRAPER